MRSELAERLLSHLMAWDVTNVADQVPAVQALAELKYDEYQGFVPGAKFVENLARWLEQFEPEQRKIAYDFVRNQLVFISNAELGHLVEIAYVDFVEPKLIDRIARETGKLNTVVRQIRLSKEFQSLRRRTLVLGLSDGAQVDRLRRASGLSHEQFGQDYDLAEDQMIRLCDGLEKALKGQSLAGEKSFAQVILVDDFSGSGRTLLRKEEQKGEKADLKGKLWRFHGQLLNLQEKGYFSKDVEVVVLLYVCSEQALVYLREICDASGLSEWQLEAIQVIPLSSRVEATDALMAQLCRDYYDPSTKDVHKDDTPLGFSDCALPIVFSHNTPNNSVCLLWAESSEEDGLGRKALFPRYERHHRDRP